MTSVNADAGISTLDSANSPGRLIAAARESKSIGSADLAARLRLDGKIIKALERDDFENLPSPTFIKGYIRSISKELGVDADPILEAYAAHGSIEPAALADFSSRVPEQVGIDSTIVKVVTYALSASLVVLIVLWWRSTYQNGGTTTPDELEKVTADLGKAAPLPYAYEVVEHDNKGWRVAPPAGRSAAETVVPAEMPANEEDPLLVARAGVGVLHIATDSKAWVEVYNGAGDKLYYDMVRVDAAIEITGHTVYRLIVGNSGSVTIRLNGDSVDLEPHSFQGVARLELESPPRDGRSAR